MPSAVPGLGRTGFEAPPCGQQVHSEGRASQVGRRQNHSVARNMHVAECVGVAAGSPHGRGALARLQPVQLHGHADTPPREHSATRPGREGVARNPGTARSLEFVEERVGLDGGLAGWERPARRPQLCWRCAGPGFGGPARRCAGSVGDALNLGLRVPGSNRRDPLKAWGGDNRAVYTRNVQSTTAPRKAYEERSWRAQLTRRVMVVSLVRTSPRGAEGSGSP